MNQYRIKEYNKRFTIEIRVVTKTGFLWWRKEVINWHDIDIYGRPVNVPEIETNHSYNTPPSPDREKVEKYITLSFARDRMCAILNPTPAEQPKYHSVNPDGGTPKPENVKLYPGS